MHQMACNKFFRHSHFSIKHSIKLHRSVFKNNVNIQILNELQLNKTLNHSAASYYSTFLHLEKKDSKKNFLRLPKDRIIPALLFSSQGNENAYQVVITNPAKSSTEFTSEVSSISELSKVLSESGSTLSDVSVPELSNTLSENLQAVVEVAEPSFTSIGLAHNTPVGLIQMLLEYMHISMEMPWWMAIVISTLTARILLLPLLIKTQRNAINMANNMPQLQYLQAKFGEARRSGNTMEASRYAQEVMSFMQEHKISPIKSALLPMAQAPVFISFFLGLRGMARVPVESMKEGGLWWTLDLTVPDPYYIMPVIACSTLYVVLKVGAESGIKMENMKMAKYFVKILPFAALPFCINFPAAVLYYWCTTNIVTLMVVSILKIPPVRQYLKLPTQRPVDPKFIAPKKKFVASFKEAIEDQKALATVEDRRRMDEIRFQKAGTGPIPRTYSYDPTKVTPSNVAATANRNRQSVSAKEHKT